ncbi:MAG: hypothetical protein H7232_01170, partial [Aeromicrobium sp.]|nr:hypothetical protein [Burkholderiales bacterium]
MSNMQAMPAAVDHVAMIVRHLLAHQDPNSVPLAARNAAKMFMFDSIGVAVSGASVAESALVRRAAAMWGHRGGHIGGQSEGQSEG